MNVNINEHEHVEQKPQKSTRRLWPLVALGAIMMYVAPTVNLILQRFITAKWTIVIDISGFRFNIVLLICEIIFTWIIMGISFIAGMFALPEAILGMLTKQKISLPVRILFFILFPLVWLWTYALEEWYYRHNK